jgi:hypothetical protein
MKELVKVSYRENNKSSLFFYDGMVYEVPNKDAPIVVNKIKKKIEEYQKHMRSLLNYAAALGVIIIPTTPQGENPFKLELKNYIKRTLEEYSINTSETLEKYLQL